MSEFLPATSDGHFDAPLGIKLPLLPAAPLGQTMIQRRFLVPLGARPIAILDPSIFLQRSIDDFPADLFQEPAFFPTVPPQQVQRSDKSKISNNSLVQPSSDSVLPQSIKEFASPIEQIDLQDSDLGATYNSSSVNSELEEKTGSTIAVQHTSPEDNDPLVQRSVDPNLEESTDSTIAVQHTSPEDTTVMESSSSFSLPSFPNLTPPNSNTVSTLRPQDTTIQKPSNQPLVQPSFDLATSASNTEIPITKTSDVDTAPKIFNASVIQSSSIADSPNSEFVSAIQATDMQSASVAGTFMSPVIQPSLNSVISENIESAIVFKDAEHLEAAKNPSVKLSLPVPEVELPPSQNSETAPVVSVQLSSNPASLETNDNQILQKLDAETTVDSHESLHLNKSSSGGAHRDLLSQSIGANIAAMGAPSYSLVQLPSDQTETETIAKTANIPQNTTEPPTTTSPVSNNFSALSSKKISSEQHSQATSFSQNLVIQSSTTSKELSNVSTESFFDISEPGTVGKPINALQSAKVENVAILETSSIPLAQPVFEQALLNEFTIAPQPIETENSATFETPSTSLVQAYLEQSDPTGASEITRQSLDIANISATENSIPSIQSLVSSEGSSFDPVSSLSNTQNSATLEATTIPAQPFFDIPSAPNSESSAISFQNTDAETVEALEPSSSVTVQTSFDRISNNQPTIAPQTTPASNEGVSEVAQSSSTHLFSNVASSDISKSIILPETAISESVTVTDPARDFLLQPSSDSVLQRFELQNTITENIAVVQATSNSLGQLPPNLTLEEPNPKLVSQNTDDSTLETFSISSSRSFFDQAASEPNTKNAIAPEKANIESSLFNNPHIQASSNQALSNSDTDESISSSSDSSFDLIRSTESFHSDTPTVENQAVIPSSSILVQPAIVENIKQSRSSRSEKTIIENPSIAPVSDTEHRSEKLPASVPELQLLQSSDKNFTPPLPQVLQNLTVLQPLSDTPSTSAYPSVDFAPSLAVIQRALDANSRTASPVQTSTGAASEWKPMISQRNTSTVQRSELPQGTARTQNHAIATIPTIQAQHNSDSESIKQPSQFANNQVATSEQIETLAQAVYRQLKQRLRIEQERYGRNYSGRLPW